jgi:hypothetical protein
MGILSWGQPTRVKSIEAWKSLSADGAPPGVYSPNMSAADMKKWKAKLIGPRGGDPRVEIRKTSGAQILIIVRLDNKLNSNVTMSMNGPAWFSFKSLDELPMAVEEAREALVEQEKASK